MKLDDVKKLQQKKYRTQLGYYLVEGEHLILELAKAATDAQSSNISLFVTDDYEQWVRDKKLSFNVTLVSQKHMAQLSNTKTPQGIVACVPLPTSTGRLDEQNSTLGHGKQRCVYLHEVQDPGNLGTIMRTLAWFGEFRLLLSPNSVDPFNPKVVRSSMGAIFHLPLEVDVPLDDLAARFNKFAYLDMQGRDISDPSFAQYDCYLFGNEARGVPKRTLTEFDADAFNIAGSDAIDSLNLATAVSISAYQLSKSN